MSAPIDVTAAIIEKGGKFLVAKRRKGQHLENKWEFPGGKVELGESYEECLCRELQEEFGITAKIKNFVAESIFNYGDRTVRLRGYYAEYVSGDFKLNAHDEIRWITADEFSQFDFAEADLPILYALTKSRCG